MQGVENCETKAPKDEEKSETQSTPTSQRC